MRQQISPIEMRNPLGFNASERRSGLRWKMHFGWPYPKRVKFLQELAATRSGHTHGIRFQNKFQHMQIYRVPIELPKYRLKNGRTAAAQIEYLATHPKASSDIFSKDPESEEAQKIQHQLLKKMVNDQGLFDYFRSDHEQELPFILTNTGFIVNGNRRVCAMRELLDEDRKKYERFATVDIVILPPCSEQDIDWLEGKEQIHKDITADYSWVTTAVMYRTRMQEHKQDIGYVSSLYEVKKSDISEMLDMLSHAEAYLNDREKKGQYSAVVGAEYAFRQLRRNRAKVTSESKKEIYNQLAYALIDKPEGDRAYKSVADTAKYFDKVLNQIKAELHISGSDLKSSKAALLGGGPSAQVAAVLDMVSDQKNRERVREIIREIITSENLKEQEAKAEDFVLLQVRKANNALLDAKADLRKGGTKDGVPALLDEIEASVASIRKWANAKAIH